VTDRTGSPLSDAEVTIKPVDHGGFEAKAKTDQNGVFKFDAILSQDTN